MGIKVKKQLSILVALSLVVGLLCQMVWVKESVKAADAAVEVELQQISRPNEIETGIAEGLGELVVQRIDTTNKTLTAYSKFSIEERGWVWIDNTVNTTYPGNESSSTLYTNAALTKMITPDYKVYDKLGERLYAYYLDKGTYYLETSLYSYVIGVDLPLKQGVYGYFLPSSQAISVDVEVNSNTALLHCTSVMSMSDVVYYWAKDTSTVDVMSNNSNFHDFYTNKSLVSDIEVDLNGEYSVCAFPKSQEWEHYPVDIHVTVDGIGCSQGTASPAQSPTLDPTPQPPEQHSSYILCGEFTGWGGSNSYPSSAKHEQGNGEDNFYYTDLTNMICGRGYGCGLELMNPYNAVFSGAENEMAQFIDKMKNPCIKVILKNGGAASSWNWETELSFPSGAEVTLPEGYLDTGYFALFGNDDVITEVEIYDLGQGGSRPIASSVPTPTEKPEETVKPSLPDDPEESIKPEETAQPEQTDNPIVTANPGNRDNQNPVNVAPTRKPDFGNTGSAAGTKVSKPGKVKGLFVNSRGKRKVQAMWIWADRADGYQVQYAYNRSFTKQRKNKNVNWLKDSVLLKNLKKKKTCYVRVRAYKLSKGKRLYGKWSNIKKCKVR